MVNVFIFRGTGETYGNNMCYNVTDKLNDVNVIEIDYPATIGPVGGNVMGESLEHNIAIAGDLFEQALRKTTGRYAIVGYSLGALVATKILERIESNELKVDPPRWSVLIANPLRNPGDSARNECGNKKYGIYGKHSAYPEHTNVIELASGRDMITCSHNKSPLRAVSMFISPFEFLQHPDKPAYDFIAQLRKVQADDRFAIFHLNRYIEAFNDIIGYLVPWGNPSRTQHTMYNLEIMPGTNKTWTDWAAGQINLL